MFDPTFAVNHLDDASVAALVCITPIASLIPKLQEEKNTYVTYAKQMLPLDHTDVAVFTDGVLLFWRQYGRKMPTWRKAAKIVFSIPASSAAAERVFALLKNMCLGATKPVRRYADGLFECVAAAAPQHARYILMCFC